jgi:bifunctional non-homologous end joining protein LigD
MAPSTLPDWLVPMAATLTAERFSGPEWMFERKFDGIRLLAYKRAGDVKLYSRNQLPQHLPTVAAAVARLPARELILDGELLWDGSAYHVFDLLWHDGENLCERPIEERLQALARLPFTEPLHHVKPLAGDQPWLRAAAEGWEGVIAKRRGSRYEHRRSPHWLKMKIEASQELVVGGFTDPQGKRAGLGALLVGYHDGGDLVFAGKVGTGFDNATLLALRAQLDALEISDCPFTRAVGLPRLRAHWVKPELVVQVAFMEWTRYDKMRHPRLVGIRADKRARDVVREQP